MTDRVRSIPRRTTRPSRLLLSACLASLLAVWPFASRAQDKPASSAVRTAAPGPAQSKASAGPQWAELTASEQQALAPLRGEWTSIDELGKRKWLQIAARYPAMSEADQARLQARMVEWTKLSAQERSKVRLQFLEARKIPTTNRQADWKAYQALTPEERKALAARASRAAASAPKAQRKASEAPAQVASGKRGAVPSKGVTPQVATPAAPAKPATPSVVQAAPGATTVLITKRKSTPQQPPAGNARIAASADVVDTATLLPRAGAQSPYSRPASAPVAARR